MKNQGRLWLSYRRPRGKAGSEGEVNNVGINKYSESEEGEHARERERDVEREWERRGIQDAEWEKPTVLPINKPAQHYCRLPQSLSIQERGIRESAPSDQCNKSWSCSCVGVCIRAVWVWKCAENNAIERERECDWCAFRSMRWEVWKVLFIYHAVAEISASTQTLELRSSS